VYSVTRARATENVRDKSPRLLTVHSWRAFVVSTTIGLDAGHASANYVQLYHGNAALPAESLEVIQRTSALILSAIETPAVVAEEADAEPALAEAS
jgi:hypothetical protein